MIYDIVFCVIIAASFFLGLKRGLLRTVWGLAALIITIVLTGIARPYVSDSFKNSIIASQINGYVYSVVEHRAGDILASAASTANDAQELLSSTYPLPEKYMDEISNSVAESTESAASAIAKNVTDTVIDLSSGIFLFLIIRLFLSIIYRILKFASALPILRETNRIFGGLIQMLITLCTLYTIFAVAAIAGVTVFDETTICSFMYNNNLLLTLIGL